MINKGQAGQGDGKRRAVIITTDDTVEGGEVTEE